MTTYVGAVAPEAMLCRMVSGQSGLDLTTATGGSFRVKKPDGTIVTWSATLSAATATSVLMTYLYQAGDLDLAGKYIVVPKLAFVSGSVQGSAFSRTIIDPFA